MGAYKSKLSVLYGNFSYSTNSMPTGSAGETMTYMAEQLLAVLLMHCKAIRIQMQSSIWKVPVFQAQLSNADRA